MVDADGNVVGIQVDGLSVTRSAGVQAAALRYFARGGTFCAAVAESIARPMPGPLEFTVVESDSESESDSDFGGWRCLFLWRSPTETLFLSSDPQAFADLEQRLAAAQGGCMVNQTGGATVFRVHGSRSHYVLSCLGSSSSIPAAGGAFTGRFAEVPVVIACLGKDDYLVIVERIYADHLLGYMDVTAADFVNAPGPARTS